jgi:hypothetical protein
MNKTIIKNTFVLIFVGGLGLVMAGFGTRMLVKNITRDLNKSEQITGMVESTHVVTESKKAGAAPFIIIKQNFLEIKLNSVNQSFGTFNPKQSYSTIQNQLNPGRIITIYYYKTNQPTNNIFQIESNGQLIINHKEYQKNHTIVAIAIILIGILFLVFDFWMIKTKNINSDWSKT